MIVTRVGPGQYRVDSETTTNWVDLNGATPCHCADYLFRKERLGKPCKHIQAVFDHQGVALIPFGLLQIDQPGNICCPGYPGSGSNNRGSPAPRVSNILTNPTPP